MSPRHERREQPEPEPNLLSTSDRRNGTRWAWETIGKAVGAVLAVAALAFWGRVLVIYGLPPRMDAAEKQIQALEMAVAAPRPMTSPEVEALADAIAARLPQARKGKP